MKFALFIYCFLVIRNVFGQFNTYSTMDRGYCIGAVDQIQLQISVTSPTDCWNNCQGLVNAGGMPALITADY